MKVLRAIWGALYSLLVDDGFLAVTALLGIASAWLLTREALVGPTNGVGWLLLVLLAGSVIISARRAAAANRRRWRPPRG